MSIVKRGAYGYGQSKPVMNYHTTNSESVTTVVTEISRMSVNEKSTYTGATVQKHATLEEVCEEKEGAYSAHHGGGTVQKHGYSEQKASYQHGTGAGGYGSTTHHDSTGTAQKHGYGEQKASYQHGTSVGGYGAAVHHDGTGAAQKHGYGEQKAYQHGVETDGYNNVHHDGSVQKHGYGEHQAYQYGGDVNGVAGYDALVVNKTTIKQGYGGVHCALGQGSMTGAVHQIAGAHEQPCESEESDCSDDESDCEEELAYGQHGTAGGLQHHDAYKQHGAGGNKTGSTHQYSAYERRQNLGGGSHYESYQSTTTQGYSGGGYGW